MEGDVSHLRLAGFVIYRTLESEQDAALRRADTRPFRPRGQHARS